MFNISFVGAKAAIKDVVSHKDRRIGNSLWSLLTKVKRIRAKKMSPGGDTNYLAAWKRSSEKLC